MSRTHPTIAPAIIACIHEGRDPTVRELCETTDRIEAELLGSRLGDAGLTFAPGPSTRLFSMRVALAALAGHRSADEPQPCARDAQSGQARPLEHPAAPRTGQAFARPPRFSHPSISGQGPQQLGA